VLWQLSTPGCHSPPNGLAEEVDKVPVTEFFAALDIVGESLVWDASRGALVWVDIGGRRIHRHTLATGRHELWAAPEMPTPIGLRCDGGAIVGLTTRVALWDWGGEFRTLAVPEPDLPDNRLNEGRVAPDGSFWIGTMQNNLNADGSPREMDRSSGAIYRIDAAGGCMPLTPREYGISNTMAWTNDGRFFFADTLKNSIYEFDLGADGRTLSNRRMFAGPLERGLPDGSAWIASDISGTVASSVDPRSRAFRHREKSSDWSSFRARGRRVARSAARG
jgi:sugar lactone lactonase YvrE